MEEAVSILLYTANVCCDHRKLWSHSLDTNRARFQCGTSKYLEIFVVSGKRKVM